MVTVPNTCLDLKAAICSVKQEEGLASPVLDGSCQFQGADTFFCLVKMDTVNITGDLGCVLHLCQ